MGKIINLARIVEYNLANYHSFQHFNSDRELFFDNSSTFWRYELSLSFNCALSEEQLLTELALPISSCLLNETGDIAEEGS